MSSNLENKHTFKHFFLFFVQQVSSARLKMRKTWPTIFSMWKNFDEALMDEIYPEVLERI